MNLYDLHSNPKELHGFDVVPYKAPDIAYGLAKTNPELRLKLEPAIMKDPRYAFEYAWMVLERPWPEAEPHIMKNPMWAYYYAKDVLKHPWSEAEPYIVKNSWFAILYARDVLKRRWPEAESYIKKDRFWWNNYKKAFKL